MEIQDFINACHPEIEVSSGILHTESMTTLNVKYDPTCGHYLVTLNMRGEKPRTKITAFVYTERTLLWYAEQWFDQREVMNITIELRSQKGTVLENEIDWRSNEEEEEKNEERMKDEFLTMLSSFISAMQESKFV
jgi:hypothetical protein